MKLEDLLTSPVAFGLATASPLQRAICRIADGLPLGDLADRQDVRDGVGDLAGLPVGARPAEMMILSGIRTGKSLLTAALAVRAALTCDVTGLGRGETPRVSVLSLTTDLAHVVFDHIHGNVRGSAALRRLLMEDPTADSLLLKHPSGRPIEIKVVAGARAGASLVARWSAGAIFDEAPRMVGADDGVVNFDHARAAVLGRLLPGAQIISVGSPWAPFGPIYDAVEKHWKKPTRQLVIVRARADAMNPVLWTPEHVEEIRLRDEQVYRTDVLAEFADPESSLFSSEMLEKATRTEPAELPHNGGSTYVAAMDPATRGNSWTFTIVEVVRTRGASDRLRIALARQWTGSRGGALSPRLVLDEIAALCRNYAVRLVHTDQYAADALKDLAALAGVHLESEAVTSATKIAMFETLRTILATDGIELPPDPVVRSDLLSVRKRVTQQGIQIVLPRSSDGRHADYASSLALACVHAAIAPSRIPPPQVYEDDRWSDQGRGF